MAAALIAFGALLIVTGAALYDFRAALVVVGILAILAGADLTGPPE